MYHYFSNNPTSYAESGFVVVPFPVLDAVVVAVVLGVLLSWGLEEGVLSITTASSLGSVLELGEFSSSWLLLASSREGQVRGWSTLLRRSSNAFRARCLLWRMNYTK